MRVICRNLLATRTMQRHAGLNDEETLQFAENQVERGLLKHYNTILSYNIDVNNEKAEKISVGFKYCIFSFAFLCVSTISLIIIIGG